MKIFIAIVFFLFSPAFSGLSVAQAKAKKNSTLFASASSSLPTIVIDPGHGGLNRGTCSKSPFCEEKRVCLQTARLVKKYLDQLGYRVVMTRETDVFIPLPRRVEIASQASSAIFVSIHYNSAPSKEVQGIEIFFYDSKESKARTSSSKKLAEAILPSLLKRTQAQSRGVKKGNYYVLRETSMPAIIIEGGFISNTTECALIKSFDYQDKIARGIADGINRYFIHK